MAYTVLFEMEGFDTDEYEELNQAVLARGEPEGLEVHVATDRDDHVQVFEVWDTEHAYSEFIETTFAEVAEELGLPPVEPEYAGPAHNVITG